MVIKTPKSAKKAVKAEATPVDTPTKMKTPKKLKTPATPKTPKVEKPVLETPKKQEPKAELSPKTPKTPKTPKALKTPKAEEPVVETPKAEEPVVETPKAIKVVKKPKVKKPSPFGPYLVMSIDEDFMYMNKHKRNDVKRLRFLARLGKLGLKKTNKLNTKSVFMQFEAPITPQMAEILMKEFEDAHTINFGKDLRMLYEDEATAADVVAKAKSMEFSGVRPLKCSHATLDIPKWKIHGRDADRDAPSNCFKRQKVERTEVAMEED